MEDEKKPKTIPASAGPLGDLIGHAKRDGPPLPCKTERAKRRRKGYLNDGQWAPGYGPDADKGKARGGQVRGVYRYESAPGRWWACAEDDDGARTHMMRDRYEQMGHTPSFETLPLETDEQKQSRTS